MRLRIRCELSMWKGSCSNVFNGESGARFISPREQRRGAFPNMIITYALIQTVEKIAERSSPKLV